MYRRSDGGSTVSSENDPLLLEYITASKRRGRAGSKKRRAMNHRAGGGSEKKRAISEALRAENAELRAAGAAGFRKRHEDILDNALQCGGKALEAMLVMSERLERLGSGMSEAQERRVRAQCQAVSNFYRALDDHYPTKEIIECAEIASRNSGYCARAWTIYRWSLEYISNGGKFVSDGRGDFDHDCFITSNEDIKAELRTWMRANLWGLTRVKCAEWVNKTLIPKYVGGGDPAALIQELSDKWHINGKVSDYTVGRWMHLAGGEYVKEAKTYYCDDHESLENQKYRSAYIERDLGTVEEPSERELGQHQWIQMTAEKAEGFFKAHTDEEAGKALRSSAHHFSVSGIEANFIDESGVMTDDKEAAAVAAAVATRIPQTRSRGSDGGAAAAAYAQATAEVEAAIAAAREAPPAAGAVAMVELHVEHSEALDAWRSLQPMGGRVSVRYGREKSPIIVNGQDESIFSSEAAPSRKWKVDGKSDCTPKTGVGIMVSAYVNSVTGFGLPMTAEQLKEVNEYRKKDENKHYKCGAYEAPQAICKLAGIPVTTVKWPLPESPGVRFLHYGKDKDGYWDSDHMMIQMEDHADCLAVMFPHCKIVDEYDWSGVHGVKKADGLDAKTMNVKFGGAAVAKHATKLVDGGCLGPHPALIEVGGVVHDRKLKVGDTQSMIFGEDDPPPFYALDAPLHDEDTGETKQKAAKKKRTLKTVERQVGVVSDGAGATEEVAVVKQGYAGKPKGLLDVLFERGQLDPKFLKGGKSGTVIQYTKDPKVVDGIPDESLSLVSMLQRNTDFQNEPTAMQELTESLGHTQEKTPKKHPEVAGRGIEYDWGLSNVTFRHNNTYSPNALLLEGRVRAALDTTRVLTIERTRKFQRRANDYKRAYRALGSESPEPESDPPSEVEYADIEKLTKKHKTHRSSLDQDYKFITSA